MTHGLRFKSDHRIVIVNDGSGKHLTLRNCRFNYQVAWSLEEGFHDIVHQAWNSANWQDGATKFAATASKWSREVLGSIPRKKQILIRRLEGIDIAMQSNPHQGLRRLQSKLWVKYLKVINQEELIWFQKARCKWLAFGDKNTRFFHQLAKAKKRRRWIDSLQNISGEWLITQEDLKCEVVSYFK